MMFINDIVDNINSDLENILMLLYAYDAVLFAKSSESLRPTLHDTEIYCGKWNLKIYTSKTKAMIFERGRHTNCELYLNDVKLEAVTSFKYLGVYFFKNGNCFRTQKRLALHVSYALYKLFSLFKQTELPSSGCNLLILW